MSRSTLHTPNLPWGSWFTHKGSVCVFSKGSDLSTVTTAVHSGRAFSGAGSSDCPKTQDNVSLPDFPIYCAVKGFPGTECQGSTLCHVSLCIQRGAFPGASCFLHRSRLGEGMGATHPPCVGLVVYPASFQPFSQASMRAWSTPHIRAAADCFPFSLWMWYPQ